MPFFQRNRGTSSEIWGTGEHKNMCANAIKYCKIEPFFRRDTEWDGISDISACLVCWVFQRSQFSGTWTYRNETEIAERNQNTGTKH